jgi:hypothetical protein
MSMRCLWTGAQELHFMTYLGIPEDSDEKTQFLLKALDWKKFTRTKITGWAQVQPDLFRKRMDGLQQKIEVAATGKRRMPPSLGRLPTRISYGAV